MSVHWTEYPERVETLGALSSVLVTLDNHDMETGFTADSFRNERGRTTAYTVDFHNGQYRFHPRLDQMPGLERLLDRFNIDGHDKLTLSQFRELRTCVASALKSPRAEVDAMTFASAADALDTAERPATQVSVSADVGANGPSPSQPASPECSPGALVVCSSGDEPRAPVPPLLEPIVYQLPGLDAESIPTDLRESLEAAWWLTAHANLLAFWVRAAIDPILRPTRIVHNQGTPEERVVDAPPLEMTADTVVEVIEEVDRHHRLCVERLHATRNALIASGDVYSDGELHAPCARDAALTFANDIRRNVDLFIRITSRKPGTLAGGFLPAIELRPVWDNFVRVLRSAPGTFDGLPSVHKLHAALLRETVKAAHARAQSVPTAAPNIGAQVQSDPPEHSPQPITVTRGDVGTPLEPSSPNAAGGYTMGDIRDLMRYQRELARYEEWRRSTYKPELSVTEFMNRAYSMGLNSPQIGRLTSERAAEIAVYRQLVRACHTTFHKELDDQALLYFAGEVADQHGRAVGEMWALSTDEFGPLMDGPVDTSGSDGTGRKELNTPDKSLPLPVPPTLSPEDRSATEHKSGAGAPKPEASGGGRPKLGDGPNATPQDRARRNVYELVRVVRKPGLGPKQLWRHFRHDKDFKERVREAGEELGEPLFRKAIAWIEENPVQETQSGNVS